MRERKETQRASAESPRERRSPRAHICEKGSLYTPRIVIFFPFFSLSQKNVNELNCAVYLNKHSLDFKMRRRVGPPLNPDLSPPGYKIHQSGCKTNILVKAFFHFSFVLNIILVFFHKSGLTLIVKNDARRRELFF